MLDRAQAAAVVLLALAGCAPTGRDDGTALAEHEAPLFDQRSAPDRGPAVEQVETSRRTAIVQAASRVAPAVVSVHTLRTERVQPTSFFDSYFLPPGASRRSSGLGSGFVIDAQGHVITNDHVVRGADRIMVTLPGGRDLEARLVGTDPVTDIAVLEVRAEDLPVAPLGSSKDLYIGEWAVAIGNPFGNYFSNSEPTVTTGVISAVERHIIPGAEDQGIYLGMIQTDASINPGNSGGPLVNVLGEVIGVNSSIFSRSGGSEGLGFAIPIDRALRVAADLIRHGEVRRAWLGFEVEPLEADAWGRTRGVRIARVVAGSPAARAGIRAGARLLEAGGSGLAAPLDFENVLLDLRAGDQVTLHLEGSAEPLRLQAESLPSVRAERVRVLEDLELITVTPEVKAEQGVVSDEGALVVGISPELRAQIGFQPGDVILRINNVRIRSAEDAAQVFRALRGQGQVRIYHERSGGLVVRDFYWRG